MPITYQQTTNKEIHDQVRRKRQDAILELKQLNFEEYSFFGETVGALGFSPLGLAGFLGTFIALFAEVIRIDRNLDVTAFNVVMASREDATYASPFGLGVKFYTAFTDGTCVISANFETPAINDEKEKLYKFAARQSIGSAWLNHKKWVEKLCLEGKQRVEHLSFAGFLQLTQREDGYLLKHKNSMMVNDTASSILSTIISASLFAAVAFMFWVLPRVVHILYPACWFVRNVNKPSLLLTFLIILGCTAVSWFLARIQNQTFTVDGIGTKFFGQSPSPDSRGYISTKWLVVVFVPILPVRSFQIIEEYPGGQHKTRYSINPLEELNWAQIKETMWKSRVGYIIFTLLFISFGVWSFWECI